MPRILRQNISYIIDYMRFNLQFLCLRKGSKNISDYSMDTKWNEKTAKSAHFDPKAEGFSQKFTFFEQKMPSSKAEDNQGQAN